MSWSLSDLKNNLVRASASLFYVYFSAVDEVFFKSFLVMTYGEELKSVVVFYLKSLRERLCELEAFLFIFIEAYRKDECRHLCHVGVYVKFVHNVENESSVMFVHKRIVAGRDAHQRLLFFDDE